MTYSKLTVTETKSRLSFKLRENNWWRYLDIDDEKLYLLSNACDTCPAFFSRESNANLPLAPQELSQQLRMGLKEVTQPVIETVANILPVGDYIINLINVTPKLLPTDSLTGVNSKKKGTQYWWEQVNYVDQKGELFEDVYPFIPPKLLQRSVIDSYKTKIKNGESPTALALSLVDMKTPSRQMVLWQLVHFLLDGHHKMMAASELNVPLNILSFLSKTNSFVAIQEYFDEVVRLRYE